MFKIRSEETLEFRRFCREGDYIKKKDKEVYSAILKATGTYTVITLPKLALTGGAVAMSSVVPVEVVEVAADAEGNPFDKIIATLLRLADSAVVIAIIVCGGVWMAGYRSQSIERLIYIGAGYVLMRHAEDIRNFLQTI